MHKPLDTHWQTRPITILGLSKSGSAVARYTAGQGASVFLSEMLPATPTNTSLRKELETLGCQVEMGGHSKTVYTHSKQVIISPGIPLTAPTIQQLQLSDREVISEIELAYRENKRQPKEKQAAVVGITGTNGKTTTTTLLSQILSGDNRCAPACGNIGLPIIDCLNPQQAHWKRPEVLVAELSSFQLAFSPTFTADIAIFLNLLPDHLNWHGSMEAYRQAKLRLFTGEQSPQWVILNADDPVSAEIEKQTTAQCFWFSQTPKHVFSKQNHITIDSNNQLYISRQKSRKSEPTVTPLFSLDDFKPIGRHNWDNLMGAIAAAMLMNVSTDVITRECLAFQGVEHRLEHAGTIKTPQHSISFYNDSKATNTEAAISALKAFEKTPVILIAGGRDKHEDLTSFSKHVHRHAHVVILIGEAQERFSNALKDNNYQNIHHSESLEAALEKAIDLSEGRPILFSPACASFDSYKNFEERGTAFKTELGKQMERGNASVATTTNN